MGNGVANAIVEGRILEILSAHVRGGTSVYTITERLNSSMFVGASRAWFKHGFTSHEVRLSLSRLKKAFLDELLRR